MIQEEETLHYPREIIKKLKKKLFEREILKFDRGF